VEDFFKFLFGANNSNVDRVAFWTFVVAFATIVLSLIAWYQLLGLRKISKADFINKFTDNFFNTETQRLILLPNYNALEFKVKEIFYGNDESVDEFPYFKINEEIIKQLPLDKTTKRNLLQKDTYTAFEIDDLLLGYFEDIGCFEKDNLIRIQGVYDGFDWYIQIAWTNSAISEYVKYSRGLEMMAMTFMRTLNTSIKKTNLLANQN
jgi:hypothetical protein